MDPSGYDALAIRPGEHACSRFTRAEDRDRLAAAFIRDGLRRGHKVLHGVDREDLESVRAGLNAAATEAGAALESGQLIVRAIADDYMPHGDGFDPEAQIARWRHEHAGALAGGYSGLSAIGDGTWALAGPGPDCQDLPEFEEGMNRLFEDETIICLCQYDQRRFDPGTLSSVAEAHDVVVPPELVALGRSGEIAAAHRRSDGTLRLAGALDFSCAASVTELLRGYYHGDVSVDLADLSYVDVTGLRALRPSAGHKLRIIEASSVVRRLIDLLAWDTDSEVDVPVERCAGRRAASTAIPSPHEERLKRF
jgi:ABC-type transporter Mla MlaB component